MRPGSCVPLPGLRQPSYMVSMTSSFIPAQHPRSTDGKFVETVHSEPESALSQPLVDDDVAEQIEFVTFGRPQLERRFELGEYEYLDMINDRRRMWEDAGGEHAEMFALTDVINVEHSKLTPDVVERVLEITHYRAESGNYVSDGNNQLKYVRDGDGQADREADRVLDSDMAAGEISPQTARNLSERLLQEAVGKDLLNFPRLAEMAARPYSGDAGASDAKVDALHSELHTLRKDIYSHSKRARHIDVLFTYALHGETK